MHRFGRAFIAAVAVLTVGCAGSSESPSVSPPPSTPSTGTVADEEPTAVGGVVATIGTNRLYAPNRELGLGLENVGDAPVVVLEHRLDSDLFTALPMTAREVVLHPGQRFVLPLPYGEARCDGQPDVTFAAIIVVDDGEALRVPATEDHPGAIGRLHGRECAAAEVHERVEIRFGDQWTRDGVAVTGDLLLLQRETGPPVAMDDAVGNVIFTLRFEQDEHPVLRVTDDEPTDRVSVTISADRCDAHAVAEFKTPFVFLSWVAIGDDDPVPVELELTGAARAVLEELLATCSS